VYEEGYFSRAAQKLHLTQSTVSGHIKNLEAYIGARLFDRLPRRIVPTQAGQILYRRGCSILDEKEATRRELQNLLNCTEGSLTICCSTIPGEYLLPQIMARYHVRFPGVKVQLQISDSQSTCNEVLRGKVELGFAGAKLDGVGLEFHHFAADELVLAVPNSQEWRGITSITPDLLATQPFLAREAGSGTRTAFEKQVGLSLNDFNVVGCFSSANAIKEAVRAGLGVSVISLLTIKSEIANGELHTVQIEGLGKIHRDFFAVVNNKLTMSPLATAFLDCALTRSTRAARTA
jgi:DNA-binding transcriptional LysR family regulator